MIAGIVDDAIRRFERRNCSPNLAKRAGGLFRQLVTRGLDRDLLVEIQNRRLRDTLGYVSRYSPFYRRMFGQAGLDIAKFSDKADLAALPFTSADDIRDWKSFLCVPDSRLSAVFATSGTTGEPKRVYYTFNELQFLTNFYAAAICTVYPGQMIGLIALPMSHGLWIGGSIVQRAVERAGGLPLPVGADDPEETIAWMRRFSPNAIFSSPSYMEVLTRTAERTGYRIPVDLILTVGELLSGEQKERFEAYWQARVYDSYGSTEIGSAQTIVLPGCSAFHVNDLHVIAEIIDPETGRPASEGELVFTTLRREAMPLVRYRSGDRGRWAECGCWLPLTALELTGRIDDMFVAGDMNMYGRVIAGALAGVSGATGRVAIRLAKTNLTDTMLLEIEGCGIDAGAVHRALLSAYPELKANTANGNLILQIKTEARLNDQFKTVKIRDERSRK
jgi:phenylacetate-CoA ligase